MRTLVAVLSLLAASPAMPLELGGHDIPETAVVGGKTLVLNGAGIRQKLYSKVYVCALYLPQRTASASAILEKDQPWQVTMHFMRSVNHHDVLQAFADAFRTESPARAAQDDQELEKFHVVLDDIKKGQDLTISYVPGTGTSLRAPSGARATVPGKEFATAILATWLGASAPDDSLKSKLLGR